MYGLDPITRQCVYQTPCNWCTKWDKKCDKKVPCDHKWKPTSRGGGSISSEGSSGYVIHQCEKCGETKEVWY